MEQNNDIDSLFPEFITDDEEQMEKNKVYRSLELKTKEFKTNLTKRKAKRAQYKSNSTKAFFCESGYSKKTMAIASSIRRKENFLRKSGSQMPSFKVIEILNEIRKMKSEDKDDNSGGIKINSD
ncbi:unnamed protein product [Moneuplotes crassus]|uniref:Uncharacterized protein n=1 Tax=Euplotes crassus TaxID=5936 RepID=A0AAD1Y8B9_EUPCR|nr:unnamed protein product [Moneuplotes crassus]